MLLHIWRTFSFLSEREELKFSNVSLKSGGCVIIEIIIIIEIKLTKVCGLKCGRMY